jgi:hypothetical protein
MPGHFFSTQQLTDQKRPYTLSQKISEYEYLKSEELQK